jgi:hypothetical protein
MDETESREDEPDDRVVRASDKLDDAQRAELVRRRRRATNDPPLRRRELDAPWPENW